MKPHLLPKYAELNRALQNTTLKLHASQVHGIICGVLCGHAKHTSAWEDLISGGKASAKTHELLQNLYDKSAKQLSDFLFEFQLLLPIDKEELRARAEALSLWCQGFLTGLKLVRIEIVNREPSEMTEAINDLIEIAKMNYEEVVASEEDEEAYAELVEYIRMAVILIYQEGLDAATRSQSSSLSQHIH
ncbi:MAG: hypothetical protein A3F12_06995 [Gammaproteobacteria bacterium RIFCSPHIGHO2_12_FULL_38_14]|nr:MAG: hypothetical protein A3F12_06995 [Gammaproteobacteria bacterium RIFCSPHIGHO2_12_FULL_38_14]